MSISISCLGLFGLVAFTVQNKMREIAIRKILGAGTYRIFGDLYFSIFSVVVLASSGAIPVAAYFSNQWLNGFAYRQEMSFLNYLIAFAIVLITSTVMVAGYLVKASKRNPVDIIKTQ